ncbi:MAG: conjugal transfer protein [Neisseriaceae bacterium]|nr:MAG: conjugal transfer protein [Neisseriaceae bacterium]
MKKYLLAGLISSAWSTDIDILNYVQRCSPTVAPSTMIAIIKTESNYNPLAININNKGQRLLYQAKSTEQAVAWVNYLENHNYNFDVGLGQVNIKNIKKYGYHARDMLEPCLNLKIAGHILTKNYAAAKNVSSSSGDALLKAISAYNTGNYRSGFNNGYVKKVVYNAKNSAIKQIAQK